MASPHEESFSLILSETLNLLGYSYDTIRATRIVANLLQNRINEHSKIFGHQHSVHAFIAGSKKEGVSFFNPESDIDLMVILQQMKFYDKPSGHRNKLLLHGVPPGYALLLQTANSRESLQPSTFHDLESCVPNLENLSSHGKIVNGPIIHTETHFLPGFLKLMFAITAQAFPFSFRQTGPSVEIGLDLMQNMHSDTKDMVYAIPSECSFYTDLWIKRKRPYNNPTAERIHELSKLDAHVVPVACKGTDYAHYQWRLCYTMAEISLVQSFNATQYKVYVLLKMLSKEVIKKVNPDITSYMMKNVVLWVSELYPLEMFKENNIPNCLVICLRFFRLCIRQQFLPNYMIPSRDLLFGKWDKYLDKRLSSLLEELISERGMMALRCGWVLPNLRLAIHVPYVSEIMKNTNMFRLVVAVVLLGHTSTKLDIVDVCSKLTLALEIVDRMSTNIQIGQQTNLYSMVKKIKKIIHTLFTRDPSTHHVSIKIAIIQRVLALEKKLTDSQVSFMSDVARAFLPRMLREMYPQMALSDILAITNATACSDEGKQLMAANLERVVMPYITGTPDEQRDTLQKHTQIFLQLFKRF